MDNGERCLKDASEEKPRVCRAEKQPDYRTINQVSALAVHENPQIHEASQWPSRFTLVFSGCRRGPSFAP
jgi:hypothetical protein